MSEFECAKGHLIRPSVGYCTICGGRPVRMDGLTAREWARLEALQEQQEEEAGDAQE